MFRILCIYENFLKVKYFYVSNRHKVEILYKRTHLIMYCKDKNT